MNLILHITVAVTLASQPVAADNARSEFIRKADKLFSRTYFFHAWRETEHTVDGDDWSLPKWVRAAHYAGVSINPKKVPATFPCRLQHTVRVSWREVEPEPGKYNFSMLRQRILDASEHGKFAVKMGLAASVWETRYFRGVRDRTVVRTTPGTAPLWLADYGVSKIEERPNSSIPFQVVNLDIYNSQYHHRYLNMVHALGKTGIPQMAELDLCYLHLKSASRGEEGSGPPVGDPRRPLYEQRLAAWAEAFTGVQYKLCNVSNQDRDVRLALKLGMGQRNGFVEHYMLHAPNPALGQLLDQDGYLVVDEENPLIKENRASGDENEEYSRVHELRFGPIETWPHRYKESMLRVLQMRRNFIWAEGDQWLINPPLLHYVALELGKNVRTAPDAWCYLRESYVPDRQHKRWKNAVAVKNFERWVYQRDVAGARTVPTERVAVPPQMFEYHKAHLYDDTARRTAHADGQTAIQFAIDDAFLSGGPHSVAVKITYLDRNNAKWQLEYYSAPDVVATRPLECGNTGQAKTVTFLLDATYFPGKGTRGRDLLIRATDGDAVIRFLRVIKRTPVPPATREHQNGPSRGTSSAFPVPPCDDVVECRERRT